MIGYQRTPLCFTMPTSKRMLKVRMSSFFQQKVQVIASECYWWWLRKTLLSPSFRDDFFLPTTCFFSDTPLFTDFPRDIRGREWTPKYSLKFSCSNKPKMSIPKYREDGVSHHFKHATKAWSRRLRARAAGCPLLYLAVRPLHLCTSRHRSGSAHCTGAYKWHNRRTLYIRLPCEKDVGLRTI